MVWQEICPCGLKSQSFVTKGTINAQVYQKECLEKRLVPFYEKNKVCASICPDSATAHYAKSTLGLLKANDIQFVAKDENLPNAPELRPIERYWAIVKRNSIKKRLKAGKLACCVQIHQ